ncbi:MAG: serine/threonine-protein kinase [Akkermansiaceae bacterium]
MSIPADFPCPAPEFLGEFLPGYDVQELVSSTSHGAVYRAQQLSLDRIVSIRVLPPAIGSNSELRQAFQEGAKAMARLKHPNLVDVFDFGAADDMLFIVTEHMPGRSLHETTDGCHIPQEEAAQLIANLCRGLEQAHAAGVFHKALAPVNVLIDEDANPKIVDFGIASLIDTSVEVDVAPFVSPEVSQDSAQGGARSDIYSLGIILYKLLVGRLPSAPYRQPSAARGTDFELDNIVAKAIQPDPSQRYSSAAEMADALDALLEKITVAASPANRLVTAPPSSPSGARPAVSSYPIQAKKSSSGAVLVTLLVVAVVAAIAAVVITKNSDQPPTAPAKDPSTTTTEPTPPKPKPTPSPTPRPKPPKPPKKDVVKNPVPTPEAPKPAPNPTPSPTPPPAVVDKPDPPAPPAPEIPEFDREKWLENLRAKLRNSSRSALSAYYRDLAKNIDRFRRDVNRRLRKMDRNERRPAEVICDEAFEKYHELRKLPETADKDLPDVIKKYYKEALADQAKVDAKHLAAFTKLRITYLQALDKQITILKKQGNTDHAEALDQELDDTQKDMERFMRILRGEDPDPPKEDKDDEKEKDKKKD